MSDPGHEPDDATVDPDDVNLPRVAFVYDDDAYVETTRPPDRRAPARPIGLMGRQVAGQAFLDAYLSHGRWTELVAVVHRQAAAKSLLRTCERHPSSRSRPRRLRIVEKATFHDDFLRDPPATVLHVPNPPDARYAWARRRTAPGSFALSGVTHTLSSDAAVRYLRELVTAPFAPFDAMICTSRAVVEMVRAITGTYADYLRERFGGSPTLSVRLAHVPLGVDTHRFQPSSPEERASQRRRLGLPEDAVVALFVGRLSHHAKAHPFPMFRGLVRAAAETGRPLHLVLAGWAANANVQAEFEASARRVADGLNVTFVDGSDPDLRFAVWKAADLFTSLSDNVQETFGLVIAEAMASGLPVVATDWNGYRDLVVDGETGFLVPTLMVAGATTLAASRLALGELKYDHYLAECSQATAVDVAAATVAYRRLIEDADLRRRMGEAGRRRAVERFDWGRIIRAYESLWTEQEATRREWLLRSHHDRTHSGSQGDYPDPEVSFRAYPSAWLDDAEEVEAVPDAVDRIGELLASPLTNHSGRRRVNDPNVLRAILETSPTPRTIADLDGFFRQAGISQRAGRATLAWMLKYDLLRTARDPGPRSPGPGSNH